jgi:hypothetical protein
LALLITNPKIAVVDEIQGEDEEADNTLAERLIGTSTRREKQKKKSSWNMHPPPSPLHSSSFSASWAPRANVSAQRRVRIEMALLKKTEKKKTKKNSEEEKKKTHTHDPPLQTLSCSRSPTSPPWSRTKMGFHSKGGEDQKFLSRKEPFSFFEGWFLAGPEALSDTPPCSNIADFLCASGRTITSS